LTPFLLKSRLHGAVIRVYDEAGNVIQTHEQNGGSADPEKRRWSHLRYSLRATIRFYLIE
jgi:hypothetical protein